MKGKLRKQIGKRMLSLFLTLLMICGIVFTDTATVFATETQDTSIQNEVEIQPEAEETELQSETEIQPEAEETELQNEEEVADAADLQTGTLLAGGETITEGGEYQLAEDASGKITINTTDAVIIIGNGAGFDEAGAVSSTPNTNLYFDCSGVNGAKLTLKDAHLKMDGTVEANMFDFGGTGNELTIEGSCILEFEDAASGKAQIHVGSETGLTIKGSGKLYQYKKSQGAFAGGNLNETSGDVIYAMTGEASLYAWDEEKQIFTDCAESLKLSENEIRLQPVEGSNTHELKAEISPELFEGAVVEWSSSDTKTATVDENGKVTAVSYGMATITAESAGCTDTCIVFVGNPVFFITEQEISLKVSDYKTELEVKPYTRTVTETEEGTEESTEEGTTESTETTETGYVVILEPGAYTYTAKGEGYYGSTCGFTVKEDGTVEYTTSWTAEIKAEYGLDKMLDTTTGTFYIELETFTKSKNAGAWDGTTLDVSWFDPAKTEHHISTPEQLAGLAAIVNGIYNDEITTIIDTTGTYTPEEYAAFEGAKIVAGCSASSDTSGPEGNNQVTSTDFYYNGLGYDFDGMTVYLDNDLDMGGYQDENGWTGARYMPIGGQYQMYYVKKGIADGFSHLGSSFNGTLNGQGHIVYNIYCDRYSITNYGDSSTIGLVGRLGIHDNDYDNYKEMGNNGGNYPAKNPSVRNVAVDGYIYGRRSVGGIVGKIGQTSASNLYDGSIGGIVENCVNFATVKNTDTKGCGGIVGASWNAGIVRNCANFGDISSTYNNPTGGVVGSNEISIVNCYSVGTIKAKTDSFAMAVGTNNGGGTDIRNCYWLTGTAPGGGYYGVANNKEEQVIEIVDNYNKTDMTAAEYMKSEKFLTNIRGTGRAWAFAKETDAIYSRAEGMPVPIIFTKDTATVNTIQKTADIEKLEYVEGQRIDLTGLEVYVTWSDGTKELLEDFTVSIDRELETTDTEVTVSKTVGGKEWSYTYAITVSEKQLDSIKTLVQPTKRSYNDGDSFDPSGLKVQIKYTNEKTVTAVYQDGKFVDSENAEITYDIILNPAAGAVLTNAEWNGQKVEISYTYKNETKTAYTTSLTVTAGQSKPAQDENGVYLVGTAGELDWISSQISQGIEADMDIKLTADITASKSFVPLGTSSQKFTGSLDGDGHKITLSIDSEDSYRALIGYTEGSTIKNVIIAGSVNGTQYAAGIAGYAWNAIIENCTNEASITATKNYTAGIVGYANTVTIKNCINKADINGGDYVAGIVGSAYGVTIENCGNEGKIDDGAGIRIAGIAGNMSTNTSISGCYNNGTVAGGGYTGGIAGNTSSTCTIKNSYNWGQVTGKGNTKTTAAGGIAGRTSTSTTIENVYNAGQIVTTEGTAYTGAIVGYNESDITNYYWLESCGLDYALGYDKVADGKCTAEKLKANVLALEGAFKENTDESAGINCLPVLNWQTPCGHSFENSVCTRCGREAMSVDTAVKNLKAESLGKNKVKLTWSGVAGADGYIIYRKIGSGQFTYRYMVSGTTYTDTTASMSEYNFYYVYPYYMDGDAKVLGPAGSYVYAKGTLAAVTNLKAEAAGKNKVRLTWTASKDADGYIIGAIKNGSYKQIGYTQKNTYLDTEALDTAYNFYWVFPYVKDADGKIQRGDCPKYVYAKGVLPKVTGIKAVGATGKVTVTWNKVQGADGYMIYRKVGSGSFVYCQTVTGTSFTDTTASKTEYNFYQVCPYYLSNGEKIVNQLSDYAFAKAR